MRRPTPTRATYVYDELKQRLLSGEWRQGKRLLEQDLSRLLGVSRTPVRSALVRLEQEGLVVSRPHCGYEVTELDTATLADLHGLREMLETHAAQLAAVRRTAADLSAMDALLVRLRRLEGRSHPEQEVRLAIDVHRLVARASGDRFLTETLERLYDRIALAVWSDPHAADDLVQARREHRAIFQALRARDPRRVGRIVRAHARRSKRLVLHMAASSRRAAREPAR